MLNFWNENLPPPKSRAERAFLPLDYFHDAKIQSVTHESQRQRVTIVLWCGREFSHRELCESFFRVRLHDVPPPDDGGRYEPPGHPHHDNYLYRLAFDGCRYCELAQPDGGDLEKDFINGRFKLSAKLAMLQPSRRRRLRHYRIQTHGGYIDLIYERFSLTRDVGEFELLKRDPSMEPEGAPWAGSKHHDLPAARLVELCGDRSEWVRQPALVALTLQRPRLAVRIARDSLDRRLRKRGFDLFQPDLVAAVWAIGQTGGPADLQRLWAAHGKDDYLLWRRHVRDAIEWIELRAAERRRTRRQ